MASVSLPRSPSIERVALRAVLWMIPLVALWVLIAPIYSGAIFRASDALFGLDPTLDAAIANAGGGPPTVYDLQGDAEQPVVRFDRVGLFFNTIVLAALMLAVPGWGWRRRTARLGLAVGLLALTHVGFVLLQTKAQFINAGVTSTSEGMAYLVNWLAVLFGPIGEGLFPLAIAFGLSWRAWTEAFGLQVSATTPMGAASRNAPCPCGSGRKYKRCCGSH